MELRKEGETAETDGASWCSLLSCWGCDSMGSSFLPHASLLGFSGQATHSVFHEFHLLPVHL